MVGNPLGSSVTLPFHPAEEKEGNSSVCQKTAEIQMDLKTTAGTSSRLSTVRLCDKPSASLTAKGCRGSLETFHIHRSKRPQETAPKQTSLTIKAVVGSKGPEKVHSSSTPASIAQHPHGRFTGGLGRSLPPTTGSKNMVSPIQDVSHQHLGGHGGSSHPEETLSASLDPHPSDSGQLGGSQMSQSSGLEIAPDKSGTSSNLLSSRKEEMAPVCSSPTRIPQRDGGRSITDKPNRVGMVSRRKIILLHLSPSLGTSDRSLRNERQQSTSSICGPVRGPQGRSGGCHVTGLEQMVQDIPVPSPQPSAESPLQTENLQRDSGPSGSQVALEQLVPPGPGAAAHADPPPGPSSLSASTEVNCLRFITESQGPSSHDFLSLAVKKRFGISKKSLDFLEEYKTESTRRQYESSWRKWVSFVKAKNPTEITIDFCMSFFIHLHGQGLAANTITTCKSALTRPLLYAFQIDLSSNIFNKLPKACARLRPAPPPKPISWSLDKVLHFASNLDNDSCPLKDLTQKVIFLFALASGARVSEIVALSREEGHILFADTGELTLFPDPTFLAKKLITHQEMGPPGESAP
ncbi:uncharacterized protein [Palaemon carinicauda]|uniref:uncharacterized protein isoform X1 n=1 Tax=Palaemon carinicauda TaxID=392227 RepID=UPI0035B65F79